MRLTVPGAGSTKSGLIFQLHSEWGIESFLSYQSILSDLEINNGNTTVNTDLRTDIPTSITPVPGYR